MERVGEPNVKLLLYLVTGGKQFRITGSGTLVPTPKEQDTYGVGVKVSQDQKVV